METLIRRGEPVPNLMNTTGMLYFEEPHMTYHRSVCGIRIRFLDNAFVAGARVPSYYIEARNNDMAATHNHLHRVLHGAVSPAGIYEYLAQLTFAKGRYGFEPIEVDDHVRIHFSEHSGTQTYSPFVVDRLKPLKEVPSKWTMAHCKRALANRQIKGLRCNGVYSDDYAYDDATNYRRGPVEPLVMLEKIVESPSGWWTSLDQQTGSVSLCCHTFDSNSFTLDVTRAA